MPKIGIVPAVVALAVLAAAGGVARAQDEEAPRPELRLKEVAEERGTEDAPEGSFVVVVAVQDVDTDGVTSVGFAIGDLDLQFPLTRGRFRGRIRVDDVDLRANVVARRGRVEVRLTGVTRDGGGSVFGARAFEACVEASHWDGSVYGLEEAVLTFGGTTHSIPVGVAGRSDRRRRGSGPIDLAADDLYRVTLNAIGRVAGPGTGRADVQITPRLSNERWDGRFRGQVLVSNADDAVLRISLDGGDPERVDPFDAEALDFSPTDRVDDGVVSRDFGGTVVTQIRFDTSVPARPGPHTATAVASGADVVGSEVSRSFEVLGIAPPLVMDLDAHALEVRFDGLVRAWGDNRFGEIGDGRERRNPRSPTPLPGPRDVKSVGAGENFSVAVDGDGATWLWGRYDRETRPFASNPEPFDGLPALVAIDAGSDHAVGLDEDGGVWTFGMNASGQLGDGTTFDRPRDPARLIALPEMTAVAAGLRTTVALDVDGFVWVWGAQNAEGIGDGTVPVRLLDLPTIVAVDTRGRGVGGRTSLALDADGEVWRWGGPEAEDATPVRVPGLRNIVSISCGGSHDLALDRDGTVWAWGLNDAGQLGDGTRDAALFPVQVRDLVRIVRISAGDRTSFAVDLEGATWMFGDTSAFLGDWGTRTLPVLAPREFNPGSFKRPEAVTEAK